MINFCLSGMWSHLQFHHECAIWWTGLTLFRLFVIYWRLKAILFLKDEIPGLGDQYLILYFTRNHLPYLYVFKKVIIYGNQWKATLCKYALNILPGWSRNPSSEVVTSQIIGTLGKLAYIDHLFSSFLNVCFPPTAYPAISYKFLY